MIFIALDVSSSASSLSLWEWGEYISEAFVIVACVGECVAVFGKKRLTEERKELIENLSTILFIASLSAGLLCLIRTNVISGNVIGSLGDKAEQADGRANKAITNSSTALCQARDAETKSGHAVDIANKAKEASVDAGKSAQLADAAAKDAQGRALFVKQYADEIVANITSRKLDTKRVLLMLAGKPKGTAEIWFGADDPEAKDFAYQIFALLGSDGAGWLVSPPEALPRQIASIALPYDQQSMLDKLRSLASIENNGFAISAHDATTATLSPDGLWSSLQRSVAALEGITVIQTGGIVVETPQLPENHFVIVIAHHRFDVLKVIPPWQKPINPTNKKK